MPFVRIIAPIAALLFAVAAPTVARAYLAHPASSRQVSRDGQYVLVMVSPLPVDEDAGHPAYDASEIYRIRARYTQSGLYRNDGTTTPLWTMQYYDTTSELILAPDGEHLIVADDDWQHSIGHMATFYASGVKLASYNEADLVSLRYVKCLIGCGIGRPMVDCRGIEFDEQALTFTSRTTGGDVFVFDVTTGKLIRRSSLFVVGLGGLTAAIVALVLGLFLWMWRRRRAAASRT